MRGFYLPNENVGFIVSHRSGSRLILSALKHFFLFSNIEHEHINYDQIHDYANKIKKTRFYIITRHPINRFISGFSWLLKNINNQEYSQYIEKYKLENITDYIKEYENIFIECPNPHFLPQTYGLLTLGEKYDLDSYKSFNFRKNFDELYYDYRIIHLEDIDFSVKKDLKFSETGALKNTNDLVIDFKSSSLRIFDCFKNCENILSSQFMSAYLMCKNQLENIHNNKIEISLQSSDYQYLMDFFYDEIIFYGYNNFDVSYKVIKPEEINLKNII